jgi:hypothetical protein
MGNLYSRLFAVTRNGHEGSATVRLPHFATDISCTVISIVWQAMIKSTLGSKCCIGINQ